MQQQPNWKKKKKIKIKGKPISWKITTENWKFIMKIIWVSYVILDHVKMYPMVRKSNSIKALFKCAMRLVSSLIFNTLSTPAWKHAPWKQERMKRTILLYPQWQILPVIQTKSARKSANGTYRESAPGSELRNMLQVVVHRYLGYHQLWDKSHTWSSLAWLPPAVEQITHMTITILVISRYRTNHTCNHH